MAPTASLLFRGAAGLRIGFGHLVRLARVARALGLERAPISLRGGMEARQVAVGLGLRPVSTELHAAITSCRPSSLVVDDPSSSAGRSAVAHARRHGLVTVSLHDLGLGYAGAEFGIDGSVAPGSVAPGRVASRLGLRYAVLDPRCAVPPRRRRSRTVLIALGGGPRAGIAVDLARAIATRSDAQVVVALGFVGSAPTRLPPNVSCVLSRDGLADLLGNAAVAVTAGGLTLLEAAACGTPTVATAVVAAQRPTIERLARAGAAIDGGRLERAQVPAITDAIMSLLDDAPRRRRLSAAGRRLVDGKGSVRVAACIRRWTAGTARNPVKARTPSDSRRAGR